MVEIRSTPAMLGIGMLYNWWQLLKLNAWNDLRRDRLRALCTALSIMYLYAITTWYSFDFSTIYQLRRHWINSRFQKKSYDRSEVQTGTPIKLLCIYICCIQSLLHSIHLYYAKTISFVVTLNGQTWHDHNILFHKETLMPEKNTRASVYINFV